MDKTGQMQQKSAEAVSAPFEIALLVAKQKQPHTIAESLILPGAKILVKRVFGEQAVAKLNVVSLSDNKMKRRIEEMSDDIADQILAETKESKFEFTWRFFKALNKGVDQGGPTSSLLWATFQICSSLRASGS